jgi:energy-converting hydrogenase Eha subunit A
MNTDIKSLLIRVCGTISYLIVIFFFVTFILFLHNDIKDALKEAWSVSASFLSVLATLGAAVIAANLFNDWRILEDHKTKNDQINNTINVFMDLQANLKLKSTLLLNASKFCTNPEISFDDKVKLLYDLHEIQQEISYALRNVKIHIQVYSNISNNLELCNEYEKILDNEEAETVKKFQALIEAINKSSPSQEILLSYQAYFNYLTGPLIVKLHSKIIIELSKLAKALT